MDAREQLRAAQFTFCRIGAEGFGERTRRELSATGEIVRKRTDETRDQLTPQEEQIAKLACAGHTNPEIGAQLFLSPRTVEWHLRKVFMKLGISLPAGAPHDPAWARRTRRPTRASTGATAPRTRDGCDSNERRPEMTQTGEQASKPETRGREPAFLSGERDHTVPTAVAEAAFKKQSRNEGVTEFVEMSERGPR